MYKALRPLIILCTLFFCQQAAAQTWYAGLKSSPKSIGLEADLLDPDTAFRTFYLDADFYGFYSGKNNRPGIKAGYSYNHFLSLNQKESLDILFYLGSGVSAGYVYDARPDGIPGAEVALTGTFGWMFRFKRRISLNLSWTLEAGMHIRRTEDTGNVKLALYRNGFYRFPYPQLTIIRKF